MKKLLIALMTLIGSCSLQAKSNTFVGTALAPTPQDATYHALNKATFKCIASKRFKFCEKDRVALIPIRHGLFIAKVLVRGTNVR